MGEVVVAKKKAVRICNEQPGSGSPAKTISPHNRRYLGNKFKLAPFIRQVVDEHCKGIHTVADVFAGTGVVAAAFSDKKLLVNDILYSNHICHQAWLGPGECRPHMIEEKIAYYNSLRVTEDNYMSLNFAGTFFDEAVCRKIGFIRQDIEDLHEAGKIGPRERAMLVASLLYAMDNIANTCGHYDAYRRNGDYSRPLELRIPAAISGLCPANRLYCTDANSLVREIEADLVYIDPPYNSRQYCDLYHLLENVALWRKPTVSGVAKKMNRSSLKSDYCTASAGEAFADLIRHTKARYILLSYNDMAGKGDVRSNAKITDEEILAVLEKKGRVQIFCKDYKAFSAGKSNIGIHKERLFLCECFQGPPQNLASPMNYIGGKHKLLTQLLPLFPQNPDCFVDLFAGGCNVGLNASCTKVVFNDSESALGRLYRLFARLDRRETLAGIRSIIEEYGLTDTSRFGYGHYSCDSGRGLMEINRPGYTWLRDDFNALDGWTDRRLLQLYVLVVYAFNNQLRFNRRGQFNLPVGKRDFNSKMQKKLGDFINRIQSRDVTFTDFDFRNFPFEGLTAGSFVYADPPYLIACATYNENGGWDESCETDLLGRLDELNRRGISFALSNLLSCKGKTNEQLEAWLKKNEGYRVHELDMHYSNSNYHKTDRSKSVREVLVTNY